MKPDLFDHQKIAVSQLKPGSILCGGVGSGKSITSLSYFVEKETDNFREPKDLYIITTAAKRDSLEWDKECTLFDLNRDSRSPISGVLLTIDSWNNIHKYKDVKNSFFIFDEQRVVGSGSWVKSFVKISKNNNWILLSATPGDTWLDYIPVFIANGFYKNRTEFLRSHVIFSNYSKFPKIERFSEENKLIRLRDMITVTMNYSKPTIIKKENIMVDFDKEKYSKALNRWNPFLDKPIKDVVEYCSVMRKIVNTDPSRINALYDLALKHKRIIVFYNFDYELEILRKELTGKPYFPVSEYNGHFHDPIPEGDVWFYLVQYNAGSEGWNCIQTNCIVFYSLNYSYRMMTQAAGRIDRLNTPYLTLYYYYLRSNSKIDNAIHKALINKQNFNEGKLKGDLE